MGKTKTYKCPVCFEVLGDEEDLMDRQVMYCPVCEQRLTITDDGATLTIKPDEDAVDTDVLFDDGAGSDDEDDNDDDESDDE